MPHCEDIAMCRKASHSQPAVYGSNAALSEVVQKQLIGSAGEEHAACELFCFPPWLGCLAWVAAACVTATSAATPVIVILAPVCAVKEMNAKTFATCNLAGHLLH